MSDKENKEVDFNEYALHNLPNDYMFSGKTVEEAWEDICLLANSFAAAAISTATEHAIEWTIQRMKKEFKLDTDDRNNILLNN